MDTIIEFLNQNNGALMVIVTIVYVIATILICVFNYKTNVAAKSQLEESKRQFKETTRLAHLPILTISTTNGIQNISFVSNPSLRQVNTKITLINIGHCTAQLVEGYFDFGYSDNKYDEICRYLAVNETKDYSFASFYSDETAKKKDYNAKIVLHLRFKDLLGYQYEQSIVFQLTNNGSTIIASSCNVGEVILINENGAKKQ